MAIKHSTTKVPDQRIYAVADWNSDHAIGEFRMPTNEKIEFRDADIYIHSSGDGLLDLYADGSINLKQDTLIEGDLTIGIGTAGKDYTITFDGEDNDCVMTWGEDERVLRIDQGFEVRNTNLSFINTFNGINIELTKTGGASGAGADFHGITSTLTLNQAGGLIGESRPLRGNIYHELGGISGVVVGNTTYLELNGGVIGDYVRGYTSRIDQDAAHSIFGDVAGMYLRVNLDGLVTGTSYLLYLDEENGVDWGIYHDGTAPSQLGGVLKTGGYKSSDGSTGVTATFTNADGDTVTIKNGIITDIS